MCVHPITIDSRLGDASNRCCSCSFRRLSERYIQQESKRYRISRPRITFTSYIFTQDYQSIWMDIVTVDQYNRIPLFRILEFRTNVQHTTIYSLNLIPLLRNIRIDKINRILSVKCTLEWGGQRNEYTTSKIISRMQTIIVVLELICFH